MKTPIYTFTDFKLKFWLILLLAFPSYMLFMDLYQVIFHGMEFSFLFFFLMLFLPAYIAYKTLIRKKILFFSDRLVFVSQLKRRHYIYPYKDIEKIVIESKVTAFGQKSLNIFFRNGKTKRTFIETEIHEIKLAEMLNELFKPIYLKYLNHKEKLYT